MEFDTVKALELGDMIDKLTELRLIKADLERQVKLVEEDLSTLEHVIMHKMLDERIEQASHGGTSVKPQEHTYGKVESWDEFYDFLRSTGYFHLLEKRIAVKAYRELIELGRQVPGVIPTKVMKLSITKATR